MTAAPAHFHTAFGLTIRSALPLPDVRLAAGAETPEVEIDFGEVPAELDDPRVRGARFQVSPGQFLLIVDGIARYLVTAGRRITIQRESESDDDVRAFLLTSAWGALLHQRGDLVLQGSAVVAGADGVAFLGPPGAGKSSLAAALRQRGHAVLTDELCALRPDAGGGMLLQPGFPLVKLWPDALRAFALPAAGLPRVRPAIEKRIVALPAGGAVEAVPLRRAYLLTIGPRSDRIDLAPADAGRRLRILQTHTFYPRFVDGLDLRARHFQNVLTLAPQLPVTIVTRPAEPFRAAELADCLAADFTA